MQAPPPAKKAAAGKKKAKEESSSDSSSDDEDMETDKIGTAAAALAKVLNVYLHSFKACTLCNSKDLIYALLIEQIIQLYNNFCMKVIVIICRPKIVIIIILVI